jgi:hypothetical protein
MVSIRIYLKILTLILPMKNYTTIALLSLSGLFLSANAALCIESPVAQPETETSTTQYMLSAQTQQRGEGRPGRRNRRLNFIQPTSETQPLQ